MAFFSRPDWRIVAGIVVSALLFSVYSRGGYAYPLGFIALVPWLLALNAGRSFVGAIANGWLMSIAFTGAVFWWFGLAIADLLIVSESFGLFALLLAAPIFQPQVMMFAIVRYLAGLRHGVVLRAVAAASAWVAADWLLPKMLEDSIGYAVYPSIYLRQFADLGGASGIAFALILVNEAVAYAIERRREGMRALIKPAGFCAVVVVAMAGYGAIRLSMLDALPTKEAKPLRLGMVQSNLYNYDSMAQKIGVEAVIRKILDTHFKMSAEAVEVHGVDALIWPESVYPFTFGKPQSEYAGGLDREILDFVSSAGVPLIFGTYDIDEQGEYIAAAFVEPDSGKLGVYRKTHPFLFTEYVPPWMNGWLLQRVLPVVGRWRPGDGARVFPLRVSGGREIPVLPLVCLDATRTDMAIEGARQGAHVILNMSNDSWFRQPGANLHLAVATFRSIETRMPQLRVTQSGMSVAIDTQGTVIAQAPSDVSHLMIGEIKVGPPQPTLMLALGDWVGPLCLVVLLLMAAAQAIRAWQRFRAGTLVSPTAHASASEHYQAEIIVLSPVWRIVAGTLRGFARLNLLWMGIALLQPVDGSPSTLIRIGFFVCLFLVPEAAAWAVMRAHAAKARVQSGTLSIEDEEKRTEIHTRDIAAVRLWRLPLPDFGLWFTLASGQRWSRGILSADPVGLLQALLRAGTSAEVANTFATPIGTYVRARASFVRGFFDRAFARFVLFPLLPALPAFRLHQHIAFGGTFGEYYTYGLKAYLLALLIWWAKWAIGLLCFAAWLRVLIEFGSLSVAIVHPAKAIAARRLLEILGRLLFYVGVPAWFLMTVLG
jgi:apolipoprotein N-acyltransferase